MRGNISGWTAGRLAAFRRLMIFHGKTWRYCARLLARNRAADAAASLSFSTLFGLVPLAIIVLLVFQFMPGFEDIGERIRDFAYEQLYFTEIKYVPEGQGEPQMLTEHLDGIIRTAISSIDTGGVTAVSLGFVLVAALSLLFKIERAFNNIYHVTFRRNFLQRMVNYWAVMTLGPVLIGIGVYITVHHLAIQELETSLVADIAHKTVPYLIGLVTLFMLYFVLPNTTVQVRAAVWGAAVATVAWMVSKWFFGLYITHVLPFREIYGVIGLIPLGVIWIYITWLIVLFGLQLTFTTQHLKTIDNADVEAAGKKDACFVASEITAIGVVREVARWFELQRGPVGMEYICGKFDMPAEFGERLISAFVRAGILARASEPRDGYVPARDPRDIAVTDIVGVLDRSGFGQHAAAQHPELARIRTARDAALRHFHLKDMLDGGGDEKGADHNGEGPVGGS